MAQANLAEFMRFQSVNVTGAFIVTRDVSAIMKLQTPRAVDPSHPQRGTCRGAIVNMGSLASFVAQPGMVQYTTSKHAVLGLSRNAGESCSAAVGTFNPIFAICSITDDTLHVRIALDNASYGIRLNCVCPSWVDTPMVQRAIEQVPGLEETIKALVPFGRVACPEEVSDAVMFLCSPRSSYVTGCNFLIDGGTALRGML